MSIYPKGVSLLVTLSIVLRNTYPDLPILQTIISENPTKAKFMKITQVKFMRTQ